MPPSRRRRIDTTRLSPTENPVRVATGRDGRDLAFATVLGPAILSAMAARVTNPGSQGPWAIDLADPAGKRAWARICSPVRRQRPRSA